MTNVPILAHGQKSIASGSRGSDPLGVPYMNARELHERIYVPHGPATRRMAIALDALAFAG